MSAPPKIHFVGVAGTGMSALATLRALEGAAVTGSDRQADRGALGEAGRRLEAAGVRVFPQDGSGVDASTTRVVISTAIEKDNQDLARAAELGVPVVHRADELASVAAPRKTVAVAGTSGKSTVTGMIFHILSATGRDPSLVTGAAVPPLREKGLVGNAWLGRSDLLVIEADESDGTIDRYRPHVGLLLNLSKDHKEVAELRTLFADFARRSESFVLNFDDEGLAALRPDAALTFGFKGGALRGRDLSLGADETRFTADDVRFTIPMAGAYNAENALAAAAACRVLGVPLAETAAALTSFQGVARRFQLVKAGGGIAVYDDFAHNPEKVRAALAAAHLKAKRVLAVFQLHGFAPARFLKDEFIAAFREALGPDDRLWLPDIYYAGGTAAKDISARDYADALAPRATYAPDRAALPALIKAEARAGDLVLVMGARDPSLSDLAAAIASVLIQ